MTKSSRATPGSAPPPTWIKPQLAKLVNQAPDGPDWLHELKLDGYRIHSRNVDGEPAIMRIDAARNPPPVCFTSEEAVPQDANRRRHEQRAIEVSV
jgi:hypothetical protein